MRSEGTPHPPRVSIGAPGMRRSFRTPPMHQSSTQGCNPGLVCAAPLGRNRYNAGAPLGRKRLQGSGKTVDFKPADSRGFRNGADSPADQIAGLPPTNPDGRMQIAVGPDLVQPSSTTEKHLPSLADRPPLQAPPHARIPSP
jgi:hypothetical protein